MNPWDNDPIVQPAATASAAPASDLGDLRNEDRGQVQPAPSPSQPWKNDPPAQQPWSNDPVVSSGNGQNQDDKLPVWAHLAQGEIEQQERGHKLVQTSPGVYEMQSVTAPRQLSLSEKTAILDAYRKNYGNDLVERTQGTTTTARPEAGQEGAQSTAQIVQAAVKGNSALQNFSGAAASNLASTGAGVIGAFAPDTALGMQRRAAETYQFNPDSAASFAGNVAATLLPMAPSLAAPANALLQHLTAGGLGVSVAGQVREDVARRRQEGQNIPISNELATAAGSAATTFLASKIGLGYMQQTAQRLAVAPGLSAWLKAYALNAGIQASDAELMQLSQNAIKKAWIDHEQSLSEGVAEAGAVGGATGLVAAPLAARAAKPVGDIGEAKTAALERGVAALEKPNLEGVLQSKPETPAPTPPAPEAKPEAPAPEAQPEAQPALPSSLDRNVAKYRITDENGNSKGVPLDFDNPVDKALYVASQPRKGKLSREASAWLEKQGIPAAEQESRAADVRDHVESHASMWDGEESLKVPALESEAKPEAKPQEKPAESKPALLPDEVTEKDHQDVLDEAVPGAKVTEIPSHFSDVVNAAGKVGRTEVVGYTGGKGRGFFHEGRLFLNVDNPSNQSPEGKREVAMHEAAHAAQKTNSDLLQRLADAAPQSVKDQVTKEYGRLYSKMQGEAPTQETLDREVVPMVVGKLMRSQRAFNEVFQDNRGLLARGVDALLTSVRSLTEKGRYQNQILASLKELKARTDHGTVADRTEAAAFLPEHTPRVRDEADEYVRSKGLPHNPDTTYAKVDEGRAKEIANWYEGARHDPTNPEVAKSYAAFKKETLDQWNYLESKGVKFEPWQRDGQPYANSGEVIKDVADNKHLAFFTGGDLPPDHPLAERTGIVKNGQELTYNDVFRAVHDYFGHAKEGVGFGPRGEENAWRSHSQMYSPEARPAMGAETRGQNSWVNFGPHGEHNQANPKETHYAEQKATLLPSKWVHAERDEGPAFLADDYKPRGKKEKEALDTIRTHLTSDEFQGLGAKDKKKAVEMFNSLPPNSEFETAARTGVAMKGWYERSADTIRRVFGKDAEKFTDLLAALSPRQSVVNNLREATKVWAEWTQAGRPTEPERLQRFLKTRVRSGEFNMFGQPELESLVGLSTRIPNAVRALSGQNLSGPKVTGFAENLQGNYEHTTNDTWMATFGGVDQKDFNSPGGYLGYTAKLRQVAAQMGWTPANVQETVWSTMKTLAENVKGGKSGADAFRGMTHEQVAATPAFDNLMGDADVAKQLQRIGLQPPKATTETGFKGPVVSDLTPEHQRIAERAEQWAASKGRSVGSSAGESLPFSDEGEPLPVKPDDEIPFLPGGEAVKKFWDEDVKSSLESVGAGAKGLWAGVKRIFAPQTRDAAGASAGETWRARGGELAQRLDRLDAAFGKAKKYLDAAPQATTRTMIDEIERGLPQSEPKLQPVADAIRAVLDNRLHQVQALGTGKLSDFVENYFPHLWENPKKAASVYAGFAAKAPLEGAKGFLKARTLPLFSDGIARGLVPVTENPVEAMMLRVREMDKYITSHQAMQELDAKGLLRTIKARDPVPAGYAKINDNIATTFAKPSRRGALQIASYKVAPESVANLINNHLSPGLRGDPNFGPAFRGFLGAGNLMNSVQLGLSGFHLAMTTMDSATGKVALAFRQIGEGQFGKAGRSLLESPFAAIKNVSQGNKMMKEWFHPGSTDPDTARIVDWMKQAGGRAKMDDFYHAGVVEKMTEAFRKGNYLGAALRAPLAGIELAGKPLMEKIVPRMKMGAFMDMARFELERLGPTATPDETRRAMGKAWDSVDNRMGQLVYDNLFWNKAAKDLAMASTRSVGWNLGTLRELGGGALDFSRAGLNLVRGRNAEFTHRMAYTAAMPVVAGVVGGMIHYLMTGKGPEEIKDYFFPKTGQKDNGGHDVRLALPSYMKDVYAYAKSPTETVKNKVHPLVHAVWDMLSNSDYYGQKIRNEDDPIMQQLGSVAKFAGKQFLPFSTREVPKLYQEGQGAKSLLPLIGITKARKDITYSPAELKASELIQDRIPRGTRTEEQVQKSATIRDFARGIRDKQPGAIDAVNQAVREGKLTPGDIDSIKNHVRHTGLSGSVQSLDMHDAMQVWEKASPAERLQLGPTMFAKLRGTKAVTREQKIGYLQTLQRDWKAVKVPGAAEPISE